jgi:phage-related protein
MSWSFAFYQDAQGRSPVLDFLFSLSQKEQDKCFQYIQVLLDFGNRLPAQYAKHIEGDLWELRPEFGGVEMRLFYFTFAEELVVFVHGLKKKTQKTRRADIDLAMKRVQELQS